MLTYSVRPRGGVVHALKLAERLKTLGVDVTLYSLAKSDDPISLRGYFREVSAPFEIFPYDWSTDLVTRLENMIASYSANLPRDSDIYHAQDCVGGTALARMKSKGLISAPIFRTIHHIDELAEPRLYEFEKKAVATADRRFVVSRYWKEALAREYGYESDVTYNGMDTSDFSKSRARETKEPIVLFVGGLEPRKGLEQLIQAMRHVVDEVPEARLISVAKTGFLGTDEERWYRELAGRLGIVDNVELHESVSQETLLGLYADCSLVALPSKTEGWGLSLMEGMACGKPVVATRVGGIPELVRDGVDGILVDAGDEDALSESIIRLLRDPSLRKRMGDAGVERVAQFSWDETARVALAAYRKALHAD